MTGGAGNPARRSFDTADLTNDLRNSMWKNGQSLDSVDTPYGNSVQYV